MCVGGQWGTVCNDSFDQVDIRVACRQMGFSIIGKYSLPFFPTLGSYDTQYTNTAHSYLVTVKFLVQYMYVRLLYCE